MLQVIEAVEQSNAGDRKGANKVFDKVLERHPTNVDAHAGRGVNRYLLDDERGAREDLSFAFSNRAWEEVTITQESMTEVVETKHRLDLIDLRRTGAAMLIVLEARGGDKREARGHMKKAGEVFGTHPVLQAADARLNQAEGNVADGWNLLLLALEQPDPTLFITSIASEMLANDPNTAPPLVHDRLTEAGQWTVHYNTAIGHLRDRAFGNCVKATAEGLEAFPGNRKMLDVGYPCAARVDVPRAEAWLQDIGGPRHAEAWSVLAHARTLADHNHDDKSLALLKKMDTRSGSDLAQQRETLALDILVSGGRLDEAIHHARGDAPLAEANLGYALMTAERFSETVKLLTAVCPQLKGMSGYEQCQQMLTYSAAQ
jgi:hypothetical protein